MGRPISKILYKQEQYFGDANNVLMPVATIHSPQGTWVGNSFILEQLSANSFICQKYNDPTIYGPCTLTNNPFDNWGQMYLAFNTNPGSNFQNGTHFIAKIDDETITDYYGNTMKWQIYGYPSFEAATAYVWTNAANLC